MSNNSPRVPHWAKLMHFLCAISQPPDLCLTQAQRHLEALLLPSTFVQCCTTRIQFLALVQPTSLPTAIVSAFVTALKTFFFSHLFARCFHWEGQTPPGLGCLMNAIRLLFGLFVDYTRPHTYCENAHSSSPMNLLECWFVKDQPLPRTKGWFL